MGGYFTAALPSAAQIIPRVWIVRTCGVWKSLATWPREE